VHNCASGSGVQPRGTTGRQRRLFSKKLLLLTVHGYFDPLYIPEMLPTWDPDRGAIPESKQVSSTLPQRLARVLLSCHLGIPANLFRSLYKQEKVPKQRRASPLGAIESA
jgi:hypothetical protein